MKYEEIQKNLFRLKDIITQEVSTVDRAANKRRWLIVKKETDMNPPQGPEVIQKDGRFVVTKEDNKGQTGARGPGGLGLGPDGICYCPKCGYTEEHSTGKACVDKVCPECGEKMARKTSAMKKAWKETLMKIAADVMENFVVLVKDIKEAEEADADKDIVFPQEIASAFAGIGKTISGAVDEYLPKDVSKKADAHQALLTERVEAITTLAKEISEGAGTLDIKDLQAKTSQMEQLGWGLRELTNITSVSKSDNAGSLDETLKAMKDLTKTDDDKKKSPQWMQSMKDMFEHIRGVASKSPDASISPNVGSGTQPDATAITTAFNMFQKDFPALAAMMKTGEAGGAGTEDKKEDISQVLQKLDQIQSIVKKQNERIGGLEQGVDMSASGEVQGVNKGASGDDEVAWPMDLNRTPLKD